MVQGRKIRVLELALHVTRVLMAQGGLTQYSPSDWVMMVMVAASPLPAVFSANTSTLGGGGGDGKHL